MSLLNELIMNKTVEQKTLKLNEILRALHMKVYSCVNFHIKRGEIMLAVISCGNWYQFNYILNITNMVIMIVIK